MQPDISLSTTEIFFPVERVDYFFCIHSTFSILKDISNSSNLLLINLKTSWIYFCPTRKAFHSNHH